MNPLSKVSEWHQTKTGLLVFAVAELGLSYAFTSWAIDSGRLTAWTLAILAAIGGAQNIVKFVWKFIHVNKPKTAKA